MAVVASDLAEYVGGAADDYLTSCLTTAQDLVTGYVLAAGGSTSVPDSVVDRAVLEVGSELYHRRNAPNGVAQFAALDGAPVRVARDPMVGAYPILAPYLAGGFA